MESRPSGWRALLSTALHPTLSDLNQAYGAQFRSAEDMGLERPTESKGIPSIEVPSDAKNDARRFHSPGTTRSAIYRSPATGPMRTHLQGHLADELSRFAGPSISVCGVICRVTSRMPGNLQGHVFNLQGHRYTNWYVPVLLGPMNSMWPDWRRASSSRLTVLRLHPKWLAMLVERSCPPSRSRARICSRRLAGVPSCPSGSASALLASRTLIHSLYRYPGPLADQPKLRS